MADPSRPGVRMRKVVVYWCPRCDRQSQKSWHFCEKGPALIPQLDVETHCTQIEVEIPIALELTEAKS